MDPKIMNKVWLSLQNSREDLNISNINETVRTIAAQIPDLSHEDLIELIRTIYAKTPSQDSYIISPQIFNIFIECFVSKVKPESVLVPFSALFEPDLDNFTKKIDYFFYNKEWERTVKTINEVHTLAEWPTKGNYDLIFSALPLDSVRQESISCQITEQCIPLLSDKGYCIFTFSSSIARQSSAKWLSHLENQGMYCIAMIDLPIGTFAPVSHSESKIVIFAKGKREKRFAALLSDADDREGLAEIVTNFLNGVASHKDEKLGILLE